MAEPQLGASDLENADPAIQGHGGLRKLFASGEQIATHR